MINLQLHRGLRYPHISEVERPALLYGYNEILYFIDFYDVKLPKSNVSSTKMRAERGARAFSRGVYFA